MQLGDYQKNFLHIFHGIKHTLNKNLNLFSEKLKSPAEKSKFIISSTILTFLAYSSIHTYSGLQLNIPFQKGLQNEILKKNEKLKSDLADQQSQIQNKSEEKISISQEISNLKSEIDNINKTIINLNNENSQLENQIAELYEYEKRNIQAVKVVLEKIYTDETMNDIDILLGIEDFDKFLDKPEIVRSVKTFVLDIINSNREIRAKIHSHQNEIANKIKIKENNEANLKSKQNQLCTLYERKENEISELHNQESNIQNQINRNAEEYKRIEKEILEFQAEQRRLAEERRRAEQRRLEEERKRALAAKKNNNSKTISNQSKNLNSTISTGKYIWPCPGHNRITTEFLQVDSWHPTPHQGIDIAGSRPGIIYGAEVVAPDGGVIAFAGARGGYGTCVYLYHDNGEMTILGHLSALGKFSKGDRVKQGDIVGYVGSTGQSSGPHLHWQLKNANGVNVDPRK